MEGLKIGHLKLTNRLVMAPMAGITNLPFRLMAKKMGAGLVSTEMVSAMGLRLGQKGTVNYLRSHEAEGPLSVQIFGSDAYSMASAAVVAVERGASIVDINMGCPARKVLKSGAGGALLCNPGKVKEIVRAVRVVCPVPLTVKMRAGWRPGEPVASELARLVEDCGADAVTLHPRYVTQSFSGNADWGLIEEVKARVKVPVIGNGDVYEPAMASKMRERTGCDGVMIGRGAVGNPWIFKQILEMERGRPIHAPSLEERRTVIMEHFHLLCTFMEEGKAALLMRGLLLRYTRGLPQSNTFREGIGRVRNLETLVSGLDAYLSSLGEAGA